MHKLLVVTVVVSIFLTSMANAYAADEPPTFKAKVGESKKITFKLTYDVSKPQPYWQIIQVKNEEGFTDQLSVVHDVLQGSSEIRPQQSWIPKKPGEYIVEIFLWGCIDCPQALVPNLTMKVIVEP